MQMSSDSLSTPSATASRADLLRAAPWLDAWLSPQAGPRRPRDLIKTPFALSLFDLAPKAAHFLDDCHDPWRALQAVLRAYYSRHLLRLTAGAPLHHAVVVNDLQAIAEQARHAQLRDPSATTFAPGAERTAGHSALTLAAMLGRNHAVECLLTAGVAVDSRDALGNTALHWAQLTRNAALRDDLLAHGAPTDALNHLGAQPQDCAEAWGTPQPTELDVLVERRPGDHTRLTDIASFRAALGFEHQAYTRLGVDFALQLAVGQTDASWVEALHRGLAEAPPMARTAVPEPALLFRDDGAPWGWSVCAAEPLPRGSWVAAYTGDLVHHREALVDLVNHGPTEHARPAHTGGLQALLHSHIDASRSGSFGSRIPSAPAEQANVSALTGLWRGVPRCQFVAERDIAAGEALFYALPRSARF